MDATTQTEVTQWLRGLADGNESAAQRIWQEYFSRLVEYARRKLDGVPLRSFDEEDVAMSAMNSFCRGMQAGQFDGLEDREDLWKLLLTITARKACANRRRQMADKRGGGRVRGESAFLRARPDDSYDPGIGDVLGREPTPELAAMVADNCRHLLASLQEESLRQIAQYALEGYTAPEIAEKLGCVRRTVERKLERIRRQWANLATG